MNRQAVSLPEYVTGELRAELARQRRTIASVAEELGETYDWLQQRLTLRVETKLDDLERIAAVLGRPASSFLPPHGQLSA